MRKISMILFALLISCSVLGGCRSVSDVPVSGTEDTTTIPPETDSTPEEPEVPPIDVDTVLGNTEYALIVSDPVSQQYVIASAQTNLGNLCADAYRSAADADAAIVCAAEIGGGLAPGDITIADVFGVLPVESDLPLVIAKILPINAFAIA